MEHRIAELSATDQQFRDTTPLPAITAAIRAPGLSLRRIVTTVMTGYADRPALGERAKELVTDPATGRTIARLLPRFDTISYRELWSRAGAIAADWFPLCAGEFVAVLGFTSADYATIELGCLRLGAVSVPLPASASTEQLTSILAESGPRILCASVELLDTAVDCALASTSVQRVVVFDYEPRDDEQRAKVEAAATRIALDSLATVLARAAPPFDAEPDDDRLTTLIYTSGSTGTPKGAMYPERLVKMAWQSLWPGAQELPVIGLNYLPMSHVSARATLIETLAAGGVAYFAPASDLSTVVEDIALVRPTALRLVPRVCDLLFPPGEGDHDAGGRLLWIGTGAAPLSREMSAFVERCTGLPLHDGYGSTEAGRILIDGKVLRPPVRDYKLVDVPELGYFRSDRPHPRGELLVRSDTVIPGYYQRSEAILDADGYYRTGDIMAETGPDELAYVDRRANVLKLSQGEFVATARLETLFVSSPLVLQIFVYGSSERAYLLAVVVPAAGASGAQIGASLRQIAQVANLKPYEIPRDLLIETEPFSTTNGLLSDVRKPLRPKLIARYGPRLEQLYTDLAARETTELAALRRTGRDQPVAGTVLRAAETLLGRASGDAHFTDLGGDSLSALAFSALLTDIFGIEVPVGVLLAPANDLRQVANHIEAALESGGQRPTFVTVHGAGSRQVHARDLTLDKFFDTGTLADALPPAGAARTVLLTGANGYLGRFLCLDWLTRLATTGGTLICLVRGETADAARRRLAAAFDTDPELCRRFEDLATGHLEVVAGDVGAPGLGLPEPVWQRLAATVDRIVHPAALVNHVLPYEQLFGPNVVGTAEVIRLALTTRLKPVSYTSTIGVRPADTQLIEDRYAGGYATSKWAGEVLLREAHDAFGLPVAVFRSGMILAHSRYAGQVNAADVVTRLLLSLIATGLAPKSLTSGLVDGLPVDVVAETIAAHDPEAYQTFTLAGDGGVSLDEVIGWLADAGCPITRTDDDARFEAALKALPANQKKYSLLPILARMGELGPRSRSGRYRGAPPLSAALIHKYVTDLRTLNLI